MIHENINKNKIIYNQQYIEEKEWSENLDSLPFNMSGYRKSWHVYKF